MKGRSVLKTIIALAVRFILYVGFLFPLLRGVFNGLGPIFSWLIAALLWLLVVSILELRKLTHKIVDFFLSMFSVAVENKASEGTLSGTIVSTIAPVETGVECPNCASQVKLLNGKGTCPSCGTIMN